MTRRALALWQLSLLTAIHFIVDMLSGTLPGFLPALREKFGLSLVMGTVLLTLCAFSSNGIQLWAGTLRKTATRPKLVQLGLLLGCAICLTGLVPLSGASFFLIAMVLVLGTGVALVHPEGLRGVCAIPPDAVSPAVATSLFMLAGFFGYATGPLIGGVLVQNLGFHGLYLLLIPVALVLWLFSRARVRLALGSRGQGRPAEAEQESGGLTFWEIFILATLINTGCGIMQGLLPSYLNTLGFKLGFAGFSGMLFGFGAGLGAFGTSFLLKRYSVLDCLKVEILIGIPLLTVYLACAGYDGAAFLVPFAGLLVGAGFPQLVVLARTAPGGPDLGARMGLVVGGTWGIAGILLLVVGWIGELFSLRAAMFLAPASFLAALAILFLLDKRSRKRQAASGMGNLRGVQG